MKNINKAMQALSNIKLKLYELDDLLAAKGAANQWRLSVLTNECAQIADIIEELLAKELK